MKINKKNAQIIFAAIQNWKSSGLVDDSLSQRLVRDIEVMTFDWKKFTKYSFWVSLCCIITAVAAILADKALMEFLSVIFNAPHIIKFFALLIISIVIYWLGISRRLKFPEKEFSNEAILLLGVLVTGGVVYQFGKMLDTDSEHFSLLLLLSFGIYGLIGFFSKSNLIWLFALLSLGSWLGTETGYASGWGAYYLGMNYPLRFVLFGVILVMTAFVFEKKYNFGRLFKTTLAVGLLYLFISLWMMSIFGNYGDIKSWSSIKQIELFHWAFLFGLVAAGAIFHGLKFGNGMTKGFGITFLFINLYTRYFEYFWNMTHKAIFFCILGISFWVIGSKSEKIWNIHFKQQNADLDE